MLPPVIEKARKILLHEQRLGHTDQTVRPGGLEAFVARWTEEVGKLRLAGELAETAGAPPIEQTVQGLLQGYHALDPMQRASRVRAALARIGGQSADALADGRTPGRPGLAPVLRSTCCATRQPPALRHRRRVRLLNRKLFARSHLLKCAEARLNLNALQ